MPGYNAVWGNEIYRLRASFSTLFEFSQTTTSVSITLWVIHNVLYLFHNITKKRFVVDIFTNSHCVTMPTFAPSIYCKKPFLPLSANITISLISQLLCKESNERCILCYKLTYIKKRKGNSTAIFADKAVLNHYRKNKTNYRNTKQARSGSGKVFVF
jgi:hypothetical protein